MNIMELGAIGELVGGLAVLVTLVYLAVQVRHTRTDRRPSASRSPCKQPTRRPSRVSTPITLASLKRD